ncbi:MAG: hypothetical protein K0R51_2123 [Cytophagaceae bacterium]|jgi:hypothetical protein|nr:hypothetical protein [Cytophagaceae bacterium]
MKYAISNICLFVFLLTAVSCSTDDVQQETSDTEIPEQTDSLGIQLSNYDKNIQTLIQDQNGLIRGFSLGMDSELIKSKNSTLQKVDSSAAAYTYSSQLDPVEAADFTYQFANKKLNKIEVVIYPENEYRQGLYYRELKNYFSSKFKTKAVEENNSLTWFVPTQELTIRLTKTGSKKFHDLQLVFEKLK